MSEKLNELAIRVTMLPRDTNGMGTIFGGVILAHIDMAGAIQARRVARKLFVTKSMNEVVFLAPVHVGETVSFYTCTSRVGTTSVSVCVDVEVERRDTGQLVKVTTAKLTFVAVDDQRRPVPVLDPGAEPPVLCKC